MSRKLLIDDRKAFKIIEGVKCHPQLWNHEHDDYNNRFAAAIIWKDLSKSVQLPENILRSKWRNLRDTYKKEVKKFKVKNVEEYRGKWKFFRVMSFINADYDEDNENNDDSRKENLEFVIADDFADQNYQEEEEEDVLTKVNTSLFEDLTKPERTKENYDVLFLKSLVPYFKKLDPMMKLIMRNKIQELLINELALQQNKSCHNSKIRKNKKS